jgi:hypothetical protein
LSNIAIQGAATGTGVFTLASPATNTNRTLTLPDEAGTIDTLQRAGNVLQVVQGVTSTEVGTASSSPVNTTIAATITPTSASNKILIFVNISEAVKTNGSADNRMQLQLWKNGSNMTIAGKSYLMSGNLYSATTLQARGTLGFQYLDSPSTTSSLEYRVYFLSNDASASVLVQNNGSPSTITLMEIAG